VAFTVVVQARDDFQNVDPTYTGIIAVAFSSDPSGGAAKLSGQKSIHAVGGVATYALSVDKAQTGYTLAAVSGPFGVISTSFDVTPAAPATVLFDTQPPASITVGLQFTVVTEVQDAFGNTVTAFSDPPTLGLGIDPSGGAATLTIMNTTSVSGGITAFTLTLDRVFTGYALSATAASGSGSSVVFAVVPATTDTSFAKSVLSSKPTPSAAATDLVAGSLAGVDAKAALVSSGTLPAPGTARLLVTGPSAAGGDTSVRFESGKVALPGAVTLPSSPLTSPPPTIRPVVPANPLEVTPVAPPEMSVVLNPGTVLQNPVLWNNLDTLKEQVTPKTGITAQIAGTVTLGVAVSLGYILLAGRAVLWLLLALSTRPAWKQFDPLEVLNDWEKNKGRPRTGGTGADDEETLQSLVEKKG
jgi:hypothetical protein